MSAFQTSTPGLSIESCGPRCHHSIVGAVWCTHRHRSIAGAVKCGQQRIADEAPAAEAIATTASGEPVKVGDRVTGERYEGVRWYTIEVTGYSSGPGIVHGVIVKPDGTLGGRTDLSVQTIELAR